LASCRTQNVANILCPIHGSLDGYYSSMVRVLTLKLKVSSNEANSLLNIDRLGNSSGGCNSSQKCSRNRDSGNL